MAEFTELFPMDHQTDALMHMYVYVITFDPPTVTVVFVILTFVIFILYQILNGLFFWVLETRPIERDIEEGVTHHGASEPPHIVHGLVHSNLHAWTFLAAFEGIFNDKRGQRLRACRKLPPLVNYGKHGVTRSCGECAICLEEFHVGQTCQNA
ncbi:hypothetical protein CR513_25861, partial [Mucuna pruriens]